MILWFSSHPIQFIVVTLNNCSHSSDRCLHSHEQTPKTELFFLHTQEGRKETEEEPKRTTSFSLSREGYLSLYSTFFVVPSHSITLSCVSSIIHKVKKSSSYTWSGVRNGAEEGRICCFLCSSIFLAKSFFLKYYLSVFVSVYWITTSSEIGNFSFNMIYSLCLGFLWNFPLLIFSFFLNA